MKSLSNLAVVLCSVGAVAASGQPYGLSNRVGNTTLRMPPGPPVFGWVTSNAFPGVSFTSPIALATPPGETNRLFILERAGRVTVITNLAAPTRHVFLDLFGRVTTGGEEGLLGIAFHPGYESNRLFYVYYSLNTNTPAGTGRHQRLSRFEASSANPNQALAASEVVLLTMRDEASNHNGGDLHFGPDGYLYVSLGDEGNQNDSFNNTQMLDKDFWSTMLRLDVDKRPENLNPNPHPAIAPGTTNYSIPADNPFVGVTNWYGSNLVPTRVRTEFFAIGLRNPWRFSFDPDTGLLYCGDVGGGVREEIDIITRGGNYGWAFREGFIAGPKAAPPGAMPINPIFDYSHGNATNQGNSVTGGVVYRGSRFPQLFGRYVFADYVSGNIWSFFYNGTTVSEYRRLLNDADIVAFGVDPRNGDVLLADIVANQVKRLVEVPVSGGLLPATLADTGAFTNLATLTPHAGIVSYDVNVPYWTDGAIKSRWFYVPTNRTITFRTTNNWTFPTGSVWIQHFELELTNGLPESRRRLETRFLVRDNGSTVYGVTYRWDSATNASLVPEGGLEETLTINDGGNLRDQDWRYPSRAECLRCHTGNPAGFVAGFNTAQLNRDFDYAGIMDNQLRTMNNAGYFNVAVSNMHSLRFLAHPTDETVSIEQRVRSYLAANCISCHHPAGVVPASFDSRLYTSLAAARLINQPLINPGGDPDNRVIQPGSLTHSMLLTRVAATDSTRMPPLESGLPDPQAIDLLSRWITNDLVNSPSFTDWQTTIFGSTNAPEALANADPDMDGAGNFSEWLTATDPTNGMSFWAIGIQRDGDTVNVLYPRVANRGFEVQWNTSLSNPAGWQFLNVPENRPFIAATNGPSRVPDHANGAPAKYFRVRVFEP